MRIGAVVLAAGASRRMGSADKLLQSLGGVAVLRHTVHHAIQGGADPVLVVVPSRDDARRRAVADLPVCSVALPGSAGALQDSIAFGVDSLPEAIDGVFLVLGDLPGIQPSTYQSLVASARARPECTVFRPCTVDGGTPGHPVLWLQSGFGALTAALDPDWPDTGAGAWLARHPEQVQSVPVDDPGIHTDLDTPEALRAWQQAWPDVPTSIDPATGE